MKAAWCTKCGKQLPKDANFCTACGAPRGNVNPLLPIVVIVVLGIAGLALAIVDWQTGFTSVSLGFVPWALVALASAVTFRFHFVNRQLGPLKYFVLLPGAMCLALAALILIHHPLRQWP